MKTAISIPDDIFEEAERLAQRRGLSRSELYAKALAEYISAQRFQGVRERLDAIYGSNGEKSGLDPMIAHLQFHSIEKDEW